MAQSVLLELEPKNELLFDGPFDHQVTTHVKITNPDKMRSVLFKIKTTAPKLYCVRPNVGKLMPEEVADIEICLQPFDYNVEGKRHKFLIQAALAPRNTENTTDFWKLARPNDIWDAKIRCVLRMPVADAVEQQNDGDGTNKGLVSENEFSDTKGRGEYVDEIGTNLEGEATRQPGNELTQLYQKISQLEDEKMDLKQEIQRMRDTKEKEELMQRQLMEQNRKLKIKRQGNIYVFATIFTMVAAVVGAYVGKYMM